MCLTDARRPGRVVYSLVHTSVKHQTHGEEEDIVGYPGYPSYTGHLQAHLQPHITRQASYR